VVRTVGYQPATATVALRPGAPIEAEIALGRVQSLETISVVANRNTMEAALLAELEDRRRLSVSDQAIWS
jgi:hypothetical protein